MCLVNNVLLIELVRKNRTQVVERIQLPNILVHSILLYSTY